MAACPNRVSVKAFVVLQTVAALLCSMAMAGLIASGGRGDSPTTVNIAGCTFLVYALAQLTTAGVVVTLKSGYDEGSDMLMVRTVRKTKCCSLQETLRRTGLSDVRSSAYVSGAC